MSLLILGIDPGLSGAFAFFDPVANKIVRLGDMPTFSNSKNQKRTLNIHALAEELSPFMDQTGLAVVEEPGAMPGQGLSSTFQFGKACGIVTGICATHKVHVLNANPAVWKTAMGLTRDKKRSRERATALFPLHASYFYRRQDDGRAEAALLALFGWQCTRRAP